MDDIKVTFGRDIDASELLTPVSRDSLDIQEVMRIHNVELNLLWDVMLDIFSNQFIKYATEYGLTQWEGMLDISSDDNFETRRNRILRELMGLRPYTLKSFQNMLDVMYGEGAVRLELLNDKYELWFNVSTNIISSRNAIYEFAEIIVPKNLILLFKNIKEITLNQYIGGYLHVAKISTIKANTGVSIDGLNAKKQAISGYITTSNKVIYI